MPTTYTPTQWAAIAARGGDADVLDMALKKGADINSTCDSVLGDEDKKTSPLFEAVKAGHIDLARLLIERGADP